MFIYYQNPYIDIISNIAAILYIIAILSGGLSVLDEIYKVKNIPNAAIFIISLSISIVLMCILSFTDKQKEIPLVDIESNITVSKSFVTINPLPEHYNYHLLSDNKYIKSNEKQVFKFVENPEYKSAYLVLEDGHKFKLNEEDVKFLKERGVK